MPQFLGLRYKNVNGSSNEWTQIDLSSGGTVLIRGKNGAGKSTFLDAFFFCLTGAPYRKVNKGTIVNSVNQGELVTELMLKTRGKIYLIRRGLKPAVLEIYENSTKILQKAKDSETQKFIDKEILGFSSRTLAQQVVLGSASYVPFMRLSLPHRRIVVEDILDAAHFAPMSESTKRIASNTRHRISDARERIRILEERERGKTELLKATSDRIQAQIDELETANIERSAQGLAKIAEIEVAKTNVAAYPDPQPLLDQLDHTERKMIKEVAEYEAFIRQQGEITRTLKNPRKCQDCGKTFGPEDSEKQIKEIAAEIEKVSRYLTMSRTKLNELADTRSRARESLSKLDDLRLIVDRLEGDLAWIGHAARETQKNIDRLKASSPADVAGIQTEIDEIRLEIRQKEQAAERDARLLLHVNAVAEMLRDDGIKASIVRTYLPLLNGLVNRNLEDLSFDATFELDETFQETIKSRGRDGFQYESFSEGEKQRIDMAILFAWCEVARLKNSADTNLMLFDEIGGGSLDDDGIEDFVKLVKKRPGVTTFVISHNVAFEGLLDRRMFAEKRNGFCYLEEVKTSSGEED